MDKNFSEIKRVWFITDTHLGARSNSQEWIDIIEDYFYNFFIPLVKKHYRPGDILCHLGDVFDSRSAINLKVLTVCVNIFEDLSEIFKDGIIIIPGNHDVYAKSSNDVNSLISLKWIPNIQIFEEPASLMIGTKKFLLMPWRKDHEEEKACVQSMGPHDYLLCHADIAGMKFNKHVVVSTGCDISTYKDFTRVYCGHIHYAQRKNNITLLGSPYEITRSDMNNEKGITLLDLESGKEQYWPNTHSPRFLQYSFTHILNDTPEKTKHNFRNNFVDVYINSEHSLKAPLGTLTEMLEGSFRKIDFRPSQEDIPAFANTDLEESADVMQSVKKYLDGTTAYDPATKKKIFEHINFLYQEVERAEKLD